MVNTVSRTYAREICGSSEYGFGLEGVLRLLRDRRGNFLGIVNGVDEHRWVMDGLKYNGADSMARVARAKSGARRSPFRRLKWKAADGPVVAFRARWDEQKGVRLLVEALPALAEIARLAIVTWGTPGPTSRLRELWQALDAFAVANPGRIAVNPDPLTAPGATAAHYALADFFLMPSRYEPCGLAQQECQRFGTIPIVRATGGLADTVAEEEVAAFPSPNGYVFHDFHAGAMLDAVRRAVGDLPDAEKRRTLIDAALRQRNDWESRLAEYEALYEKAMRRRA
jgi:starch synthase